MDAASKRVMWRTLASVVPGRSIVLTTHSMEEADALASRAGILSRKMLAIGTSDYLRERHGNRWHCHLVAKGAPHTSDEAMGAIRTWIVSHFDDAEIESGAYHGQLRFSVPASRSGGEKHTRMEDEDGEVITAQRPARGTISELFTLLEDNKDTLGLEYYSVSQTSLDQVFLSIVGKHNVEEENYGSHEAKKGPWWKFGLGRGKAEKEA
jgi:ABC-type multidrug transport system ATPase subunit